MKSKFLDTISKNSPVSKSDTSDTNNGGSLATEKGEKNKDVRLEETEPKSNLTESRAKKHITNMKSFTGTGSSILGIDMIKA